LKAYVLLSDKLKDIEHLKKARLKQEHQVNNSQTLRAQLLLQFLNEV